MPSNSKASVSVIIGADLGKSFKGAFGSANKQLTKLGSAIKQTSQRANQIEAFRNSSRATKEAGVAYKQAKQKLNALSREIANTNNPTKQLQNNFKKSQRLADRAKKSFLDTAKSTRQMGKALRESGVDMRNFNKEQNRLSRKLNKLEKRQTSVVNHQNAKDANLQNRSDKRSQLFDAAALGGALFSVVKPAVDFELAMAKVGAKTNEAADSESFKSLTKQARELGRTTQFTASQSAKAMEFLGMAGLKTNEILEATPSVLNLAIAGNMDLGRTADIASNILTGFNMEASRTAEVADILAQASRSTNTDVEMLGQTMKFVAPAAAAVGGSLEETASLAGVLGDAGIQATMAGTMLRSTYLRLAAPASAGAKALNKMRGEFGLTAEEMPDVAKQSLLARQRLSKLSVEVFTKSGKMKPMISILKEMSAALKDVSHEEKLSTIKDIFGTRSTAGALAIFKSIETGRLDEITEKLANADGAAKEIADRLRDTTFGAWKRFTSAIESVGISLGSVLLPAFSDVLGVLAAGAIHISTFAEQNTVLTKIIGLTIASLITLKVVSIAAGFGFTFLKGGFLAAKGGLIGLVNVLKKANKIIPFTTRVFNILKVAVMTNPIGLVIGGIAIGAAIIIAKWTPIGKFFKNIFSGIVGWIQKTFPWINKLIKPLKTVVELARKTFNFVFGNDEENKQVKNEDEEESTPSIGKVIKTIESNDVPITQEQQQILQASNIPNTSNFSSQNQTRNNTSSNISISAPVTINNNGNSNLNEQKIAAQVKEVFDELVRKFEVRKASLNFD